MKNCNIECGLERSKVFVNVEVEIALDVLVIGYNISLGRIVNCMMNLVDLS